MKTEKDCEINKNRPDLKTKKEKLSKSPSSSSKNNSNKKIVEVVSKEKNYKPPNLIPTNFEKKPQSSQSRNSKNNENKSNNNSQNLNTEIETLKENEKEINLSDDEILKNDIPLKLKKPNNSFGINYLENEYNKLKNDIQPEIINGINEGIDKILNEIKLNFENNELEINSDKKKINEIILDKTTIKLLSGDIEGTIKLKNLKDLTGRKQNLEKKIEKLEEEIKSIEINSKNNSLLLNPQTQVDENIKKAQIKEIKENKEILLQKLNSINEQVQKLMFDEEQISQLKKLNIKQFLDNFDKDKEIIEQRAKKYEEEKKLRDQKIISSLLKAKKRKRNRQY